MDRRTALAALAAIPVLTLTNSTFTTFGEANRFNDFEWYKKIIPEIKLILNHQWYGHFGSMSIQDKPPIAPVKDVIYLKNSEFCEIAELSYDKMAEMMESYFRGFLRKIEEVNSRNVGLSPIYSRLSLYRDKEMFDQGLFEFHGHLSIWYY